MKSFVILICIIGVKSWDIVIKGPSSVQIGSTLTLSCKVTDLESPPKTVVWYKDYNRLNSSGRLSVTMLQSPRAITSKLTIQDVDPQDAGKYKCWVSNKIIKHFTVAVVDSVKAGGESAHFPVFSKFTSLALVTCFLKKIEKKCFSTG